ncbi:Uncharacterized protein FWK35_00023220 [Aphis craccivora]|uniref:Glycoprotein-N-acetylgalactosamine 3-beta-galactosyltransferase 1-like n=1 Tax=Aphis craccivora TaxID=307492 RepID=A0A6G0YC11_APHCR|nr:Uncharacterized protein FWK35_00023220 [Aphis craccivora]
MVFLYRSTNGNKSKICTLPMPLLMGFVIGIMSVYTYYLLLNYEDNTKLTPVPVKDFNSQIKMNYHLVDLTKSTINHNTSLLCLIFINDIDSLLMQHNVWLDKCGNDKIYVSKQKHKYIGQVITDTYSSQPWKYYCQTIMYLHNQYSSRNIKYDWIFLAKDNVWLIYENLIHLISLLNVNKHKHNYYAGQYINGILNINAGVLFNTNTLTALVHLISNVDGCNLEVSNNESQILDYYLRKLNNVIPISNMDSYGCTLFHSINLFNAFNVKSLRPEILNECMSRFAITFQLDLSSNYYAMFYKYVLYKIRLVTKQDLISNSNKILPEPSPENVNIWRREALYELNLDPSNTSQTDFFYYWSKKRQIIL